MAAHSSKVGLDVTPTKESVAKQAFLLVVVKHEDRSAKPRFVRKPHAQVLAPSKRRKVHYPVGYTKHKHYEKMPRVLTFARSNVEDSTYIFDYLVIHVTVSI